MLGAVQTPSKSQFLLFFTLSWRWLIVLRAETSLRELHIFYPWRLPHMVEGKGLVVLAAVWESRGEGSYYPGSTHRLTVWPLGTHVLWGWCLPHKEGEGVIHLHLQSSWHLLDGTCQGSAEKYNSSACSLQELVASLLPQEEASATSTSAGNRGSDGSKLQQTEHCLMCLIYAFLSTGMYSERAAGISQLWEPGQQCTLYKLHHRRGAD